MPAIGGPDRQYLVRRFGWRGTGNRQIHRDGRWEPLDIFPVGRLQLAASGKAPLFRGGFSSDHVILQAAVEVGAPSTSTI
jgi:hypothetical protein